MEVAVVISLIFFILMYQIFLQIIEGVTGDKIGFFYFYFFEEVENLKFRFFKGSISDFFRQIATKINS